MAAGLLSPSWMEEMVERPAVMEEMEERLAVTKPDGGDDGTACCDGGN